MSYTNQQPWAGVAGAPDGIVMVRTANFMTLLNGPPQGVLAGQSGSASVPPDMVWDWYGKALYICTQSSDTPAGTVWTELEFVGPFVGTNIYCQTLAASASITDQGPLTVDGTSNLVGNTTIGGTLAVGGNATFSGAVSAAGAFTANAGGVLSGTFTGTPTFNFPLTLMQPLRLPNNVYVQAADTAGTYRNLIGVDASNNVSISNVGGGTIGWLNQARSAWLLSSTNTGALTAPGSLAVVGALSSGSLATGGITATGLQVNGSANVTATLTVSGAEVVNGVLTPSGGINNIDGIAGFNVNGYSGRPTVNFAPSEFIQWDGTNLNYGTTGIHEFTGQIQTNSQVVAGTNVIAGNAVVGDASVWAGAASTGIGLWGTGSGWRYMQFQQPSWYWRFQESTGYCDFYNSNLAGPGFVMHQDGSCSCPLTFINGSDERQKDRITDAVEGLETIRRLRPRRFTRHGSERSELGFVAQEMQEVLPECVWPVGNDGMLGIADGPILAALVNAVRELADMMGAAE